jgi:hypothetical protein
MVGRIILTLTGFLLGALAEASTCGATAVLIGDPPVLTAGSATANIGDEFTIPISVTNTQGLTSFQFDLAFNPSVIQALSFTDIGTDFANGATAGGGFLTGIAGFTNNTTGVLSGVADSMSGLTAGTGLAPGGTLVDVTFQAVMVGSTQVALDNVFLIDDDVPLTGSVGLVNGQVVVGVPEPSSWSIILSLVVCGVALLRRRRILLKGV